jgi:hypothetical protein
MITIPARCELRQYYPHSPGHLRAKSGIVDGRHCMNEIR